MSDRDALQLDEEVVGGVRVGPNLLIDEGPRARDKGDGRSGGAEVVALQIVDGGRDVGVARQVQRGREAVVVVEADHTVRYRVRLARPAADRQVRISPVYGTVAVGDRVARPVPYQGTQV